MTRVAGIFLGATLALGCAREPLNAVCPPVAVGDLVVTEIRGSQSGPDSYGQWVEVYHAGTASVDLLGLTIDVLRLDGGAAGRIYVRESNVILQAGGYVVLGRAESIRVPTHMDYGYLPDFDRDFYDSAVVTMSACGVVIDQLVYRNITQTGSWSLDGAINPPTATANDDETNWCLDDTPGTDMTQLGLPGSPKEMNRPCM